MGVRETKASRNRYGRWPAGRSREEWSASSFGALAKFPKATIGSSCLSVRPHGRTGLSTGRIFVKCDIGVFLENMSRKFKFR
jgi:hypothetical protein